MKNGPVMKRLMKLLILAAAIIGLTNAMSSCAQSTARTPGINAAEAEAIPDYDYLIPLGTGAKLDAGERVEIIPADLKVKVGEVLRIINEDDRGHVIGAFYVAAGETLRQRFASPGVLAGDCSVHPSGSFTLTVRA
jgi:plastocyanin